MIRGAIIFDSPSPWTTRLAASALLLAIASLAYTALRPTPEPEQAPPPQSVSVALRSPVAAALMRAPMPEPQTSPSPPAAGAMPPKPSTATRPADVPYRFVGKSGSGAETAIILFGRGRVVTVREPGPLDDEYSVDAVFDDYLVLRHLPTSAGTFLPLVQRRKVVQPTKDPEDLPHD